MILVDNHKKCSAVVHFAFQDSLAESGLSKQILSIFDASRFSEFHTFLKSTLHVWIGLGEEKDLTLTHVKSAAALASKTMRKLKQKEYLVDASPIVSLYGIDSVYDLTTGLMLGLYHYEGHYSKVQPKYDFKASCAESAATCALFSR